MCVSVTAVKQLYLDKQVMPHFMINENGDSYVCHMSYVLPVYRHSSLQYIYNTISTVWLKTFWLEILTLLFFLFMFLCEINSSQIQCVYKGTIRLYQFDICRAVWFSRNSRGRSFALRLCCKQTLLLLRALSISSLLHLTHIWDYCVCLFIFFKMDIHNYVLQTILIDIVTVWYIHSGENKR